MPRQRLPWARLRARFGPDASGVRQSLVALLLNSSTSLVAGVTLTSIQDSFERYPGLLVLVPAAIGLRGNIFGAFGNRMSTAIHTGIFRWSMRRETVLGQSVLASMVLTVGMSVVLALVAKGIAVGVGIEGTIDLLAMSTISVVGGALASVVVLAAALGLTAGAVRYGWDLDNVTAPLVSTFGDVLTVPALYLATFLVGVHLVSGSLGVTLLAAAVAALAWGWRSSMPGLRQIVRESLPVLVVAGCLSAGAGVALERSQSRFMVLPALLILVPAQLSSAGALGGILSGRLSSKLFLGLVPAQAVPNREARRDMSLILALALPVYVFNGVAAHLVGVAFQQDSPGLVEMVAASVVGGGLAMVFVTLVAYYGTIAAYRTGADPDTYGIPVVSSSVDLVGAFAFVLTLAALGLP